MSAFAIRAEKLGKRYLKVRPKSGLSLRPWRTLAFAGLGPAEPSPEDHFWALKDVDFVLGQGESLGIIGANGAGKSTLLKILARISPPTEGEVRIRGRVASLLEVGTGFQRSLSGRENIYLNGAIMGMRYHEISRLFDEIVDFAGVGEFIDMPVKNYSSGMYSRLAFSVAAHVRADILLVDEVLSVGDVAFQQKCLDKMSGLMGAGRTVLFVSHSMDSVVKFCRKALWIERGRAVMQGEARNVTEAYLEKATSTRTAWQNKEAAAEPPTPARIGSTVVEGARFISARFLDAAGQERKSFFRNEDIHVQLRYRILAGHLPVVPVLHVYCAPRHGTETDVHVFTSYDWRAKDARHPGNYTSTLVIPKNLLIDGDFHFSAALVSPGGKLIRHAVEERILSCKIFDHLDLDRSLGPVQRGVIRPELTWTSEANLEAIQ